MRESIGGAFLIKIMVVFLVLYNSLLAIAVNYAIAFRVKNQIINLLEQYEGCEYGATKIKNYISTVGYYRASSPTDNNYDIEPVVLKDRGTYYIVYTYIEFDFPVVKDLFRITIKGETKVIYGVSETQAQCNAAVN